MRKQLFIWSFLLVLCLAVSSANAGECKKIIAGVGESTWWEGCSYDGEEYSYCIDMPITGNLKGIWHFYTRPFSNSFYLHVDDVLGIGGWDLWVGWQFSVFETHKGEIHAQANDIGHMNAWDTYGAFSSMLHIIGGTGDYEGATGWLGAVATEAEGGVMRGEVCTP